MTWCKVLIVLAIFEHWHVYCEFDWNSVVYCFKRHDSGNPCSFDCSDGTSNGVGVVLEKLSHENSRCQFGMVVRIHRSMEFANRTMHANWFNGDVCISEMEMFLNDVDHIEANAFDSKAFGTIHTLTLNNLNVKYLEAKTFHGLTNLKTLQLYQLKTTSFSSGLLDCVANTLEYLLVYGSFNQTYTVNGLTNGVELRNLRMATYDLNLHNSIDSTSFTALSALLTLELSTCSIETIGPGAFDPMANSLRLLKLNNNKIKRLPGGLFDKLLPSTVLSIYLSYNPFDCTCLIADLQTKLQKHNSNFIGIPKCNTPFYLNNLDVATTEFCVNGTDKNVINDVSVRCYNESKLFDYKQLERQQNQFRLILNRSGELALRLPRFRNQQLALISYTTSTSVASVEPIHDFDCLWNLRPNLGITARLEWGNLYTFCVVDPSRTTVSPMDCSTYFYWNNESQPTWLRKIDKQTVVLACSLFTVLCFVGGICVGCLTRINCAPGGQPNYETHYEANQYIDLYMTSGQSRRMSQSSFSMVPYFMDFDDKRFSDTQSEETYVYQSKFDVVPPALPAKTIDK